jgi:hypothetical protein
MVIVATEDPDKARAWVEQTGPYLGSTPLVMVVSAQAEPMVRPYYDPASNQIKGLVIGLATGVAYESALGRKGIADTYWVLFSMGMWVAISMIIIGGIINWASARLKRTKDRSEGEAKA